MCIQLVLDPFTSQLSLCLLVKYLIFIHVTDKKKEREREVTLDFVLCLHFCPYSHVPFLSLPRKYRTFKHYQIKALHILQQPLATTCFIIKSYTEITHPIVETAQKVSLYTSNNSCYLMNSLQGSVWPSCLYLGFSRTHLLKHISAFV